MSTLIVAAVAFVGYLVAYHTYGRWLARKIFRLDPEAVVPSVECRDDVDYCPTNRQVVFGHHYTSIAGTGPIVGPAIAVFWGWLPALLWVLFGCIFIGAVHDFGALTVSLRNRGQTVGDIAGRIIAPRVRYLFLLVLFFSLMLVLAVFGLVIATVFDMYPESVLSVWFAMPVAVAMGFWVHKFNGKLLIPSLLALGLMYLAVYLGVYYFPFPNDWLPGGNPVVAWTVILLIYCYIASVLPVWVLLQPRDFVNSHQLLVALGLLVLGIVVVGVTNQADINSAPAFVSQQDLPSGAPPIVPFLFITIACGAISGFTAWSAAARAASSCPTRRTRSLSDTARC
jgi:carbon starvation protein